MERRFPHAPPVRPLVLIVESHEDTRALYAIALSGMGFEVIAEGNCANAYGRAWKAHPDVIVGDPDDIIRDVAFGRSTGPVRVLGDTYRRAWTDEKDAIDALLFAHSEAQKILDLQDEMQKAVGKAKREVQPPAHDLALEAKVKEVAPSKLEKAYSIRELAVSDALPQKNWAISLAAVSAMSCSASSAVSCSATIQPTA